MPHLPEQECPTQYFIIIRSFILVFIFTFFLMPFFLPYYTHVTISISPPEHRCAIQAVHLYIRLHNVLYWQRETQTHYNKYPNRLIILGIKIGGYMPHPPPREIRFIYFVCN